jgi:hypothetical protein
MKQILPWFTSAFTLLSIYLTGQKKWYGWLIGLLNQTLWITTAVMFAEWGLLPLTIALVGLYSFNMIRWRKELHGLRTVA